MRTEKRSRLSSALLSAGVLLSASLAAGGHDGGSLTTVPASTFPVGPEICKPGYAEPQCRAVPFDTTDDLAFSGNGDARPAVAKDDIIGFPTIHQPQFANDGYYGNGASWISNSTDSWVKVDLGRHVHINRLTLGRDRTGGYDDRDPGQFTIAVAKSDNVYANGDDTNDANEYKQVFNSADFGFSGDIVGSQTLQAKFQSVKARYVKVTAHNAGTDFDEIQVFGHSHGEGDSQDDDNNDDNND